MDITLVGIILIIGGLALIVLGICILKSIMP